MMYGTNDNLLLVGRSGAGKHLFAIQRLVDALVEGKVATVFDWGRSYVLLVKAMRGTLVTVGTGGKVTVERFGSTPLTVFELEDLREPCDIEVLPQLPVLDLNSFVLVDETWQVHQLLPGLWAWLRKGALVDSQFCGVLQHLSEAEAAELPPATLIRRIKNFALEDTGTLQSGQLVRHQDGGIYRFLTVARHTDDQAEHVIYEHVWPFESGRAWARPAHEWASRFKPISRTELHEAQKQNRVDAQAAVSSAKAARRNAEATKLSIDVTHAGKTEIGAPNHG